MKAEEKGWDVNIATHLSIDVCDDAFDVAAIVGDDGDLKEPIAVVRDRFGKTIGILGLHARVGRALHPLARFVGRIRPGVLANARFPDVMHDAAGRLRGPARRQGIGMATLTEARAEAVLPDRLGRRGCACLNDAVSGLDEEGSPVPTRSCPAACVRPSPG
jgi:hypothetical protein